ncbi:MAG: hypothetical protein M3Q57_10270 [Pseudomonadota bacterium]|nr:hypothetical protein [Pseudomonadota bacterium]
MTRRLLLLVGALLLMGGGAIAFRLSAPPSEPLAARPTLALLTSLPLMFGEAFALDGGGSPALARLEQRYNVQPIGVADSASLAGKRMLLIAHPRAQPAEVLVELDAWVRAGGRVLLLADPKLDWDSARPLGDPLRPPPYFADTGLLAHWGLTLEGPTVDGPTSVKAGDGEVLAVSPGGLSSRGSCAVEPGGFIARCDIGRGAATIVADADFLNLGGPSGLDGPTGGNLDLLMTELKRFEVR